MHEKNRALVAIQLTVVRTPYDEYHARLLNVANPDEPYVLRRWEWTVGHLNESQLSDMGSSAHAAVTGAILQRLGVQQVIDA